MRLTAPSRLKLRSEGNNQQNRHPSQAIDRQVHQFARGRVDPMRVLEHHQNGVTSRYRVELVQQRFQQQLAFALRAQVKIGGGIGQRQQLGNQRHIV